jgi:apolipoprotein N-acyltransferase
MDGREVGLRGAIGLAVTGVLAFHLAYQWTAVGPLVIVYLLCMYRLAWSATGRIAAYVGFAVGMAIMAPQLHFFYTIFGAAAIVLWTVLALWVAAFVVVARLIIRRWPTYGPLLLPFLWMGLEYFRSEMYYLKFAWITPGFALPGLVNPVGVYGVSFLIMMAFALWGVRHAAPRVSKGMAAIGLISILIGAGPQHAERAKANGPLVAGIQLEFPEEAQVLAALNQVIAEHPQTEIVVLPEYTLAAEVPTAIAEWCLNEGRYVVVGGKDYAPDLDGDFYNTAYVIGPSGDVVFSQVKSVPIQFFGDGQAATEQRVWQSPWGKIGVAVCYDLSYSRVIDGLIEQGARALIIPTMDVEHWGAHQHMLHGKIGPARAREYGVSVFRVCSSGESQLIDQHGTIRASAPFPGPMRTLAGRLELSPGSRPADRFLVASSAVLLPLVLLGLALRRKEPETADAESADTEGR